MLPPARTLMQLVLAGSLFALCLAPVALVVRIERRLERELAVEGALVRGVGARASWIAAGLVVGDCLLALLLAAALVPIADGGGRAGGLLAAAMWLGAGIACLACFYRWTRVRYLAASAARGLPISRRTTGRVTSAAFLVLLGAVGVALVVYLAAERARLGGDDDALRYLAAITASFFVATALHPWLIGRIWEPRPVDEPELARELCALAARAGAPIAAIASIDVAGLPVANAWILGLRARSRRVYLTRTLLERFERDEVLAVFAHELGHARLGHLWVYAGVALAQVILLGLLRAAIPPDWPIVRAGAMFCFVVLLAPLVFLPLVRRCELAADRFGARLVGDPEALVRALERIHAVNATEEPRGLLARLLRTHPVLERRLAALRAIPRRADGGTASRAPW